jgi:hypothetical protein
MGSIRLSMLLSGGVTENHLAVILLSGPSIGGKQSEGAIVIKNNIVYLSSITHSNQ